MFEVYQKLSLSSNSSPSLKQSEHLFPDALNERGANIQSHINSFIYFKALTGITNCFLGSESMYESNGLGQQQKSKVT